jgi:hypothetical protein
MKSGIECFLTYVSSDDIIEKFIERQKTTGLESLFHHLSLAKPEVEKRWLSVYHQMELKAYSKHA